MHCSAVGVIFCFPCGFAEGHEFNWATMDVGHTVNHLSFGPFLSETAWAVIPPDVAQSVGSLDDKVFTSEVRLIHSSGYRV